MRIRMNTLSHLSAEDSLLMHSLSHNTLETSRLLTTDETSRLLTINPPVAAHEVIAGGGSCVISGNHISQGMTSSNSAMASSNSAVTSSNSVMTSSNSAVTSSNLAMTSSNSAMTSSNSAMTSSNSAMTSSDSAMTPYNSAMASSNSAMTSSNSAMTSSNSAMTSYNSAMTSSNSAMTSSNLAMTSSNSAMTSYNSAMTSSNSAMTSSKSAMTSSNSAMMSSNSAMTSYNSAMTSSNSAMTSSNSAMDITYNRAGTTNDERVVQAILVSHNGPHSFPQLKDNDKSLGSTYVKITEQDGKYDSWVVLPLTEFQDIYQNNIDLVRSHLFGMPLTRFVNGLGVFPCEDCGYVYNKDYNLRRHRKERHALLVKRVKCPYCQKFYHREDNLIRHVRNVHNQDERCVCIHCGAEFFRYHTLKRHILTKHKDSKTHQCSLCDKSFSFKWELKIHNKNLHTVDPGYSCDLCNKTYKRPQSLAEHKKFYHEGQRVICKIDNCNELFNTMSNFKRHKREMHVVADTVMKLGPAQSEDRYKSYQIVPLESLGVVRCCECGVACHGSAELQKHFRKKHTAKGEGRPKPRRTAAVLFQCNQCATTFTEKGSYQSHCAKFHSSLSPEVAVQFPFGKSPVSCCDGVCDNSGLDLSVTSQLLAMEDVTSHDPHDVTSQASKSPIDTPPEHSTTLADSDCYNV